MARLLDKYEGSPYNFYLVGSNKTYYEVRVHSGEK